MPVFTNPVLQFIWDQNIEGHDAVLKSPHNHIPAAQLRELIRVAAANPGFDPGGIQICDAVVDGPLDLHNLDLPFHLRFHRCEFPQGINVAYLRVQTLELLKCSLRFLTGRNAEVRGNLKVLGTECEGAMVLEGVRVRGRVSFSDSYLMTAGPGGIHHRAETLHPDNRYQEEYLSDQRRRDDHHGLVLSVARIGGELRLDRVQSEAPLLMDHMEIGKRLIMRKAEVRGIPDSKPREQADFDYALRAGGLSAVGNVNFSDCVFLDQVVLTGAKIAGYLSFAGAKVQGRLNRSVKLDRAGIQGDLLFGEREPDLVEGKPKRSLIQGTIRMRQVEIEGDFNLSDTTLIYSTPDGGGTPDGYCLRATGCKIGGELFAERFSSHGTLELANAQIGIQLTLKKCCLEPPEAGLNGTHATFDAPLMQVGGDVDLTEVSCRGQFYCADAEILGSFTGTNCSFQDEDIMAFSAPRISVSGNVQFKEERQLSAPSPAAGLADPAQRFLRVQGGLYLADAKIDGSLHLQGGLYEGLGKSDRQHRAIDAVNVTVGRQILVNGNAEFSGLFNLAEAHIVEDVRIQQSYFRCGPRGESLRLISVHIAGNLYLGSANNILDGVLVKEANRRLFRPIRLESNSYQGGGSYEETELQGPERIPSLISKGRITINAARIEGFLRIQSAHVEWCDAKTDEAGQAQADAHLGDEGRGESESYEHYSIYASIAEIGRDVFCYQAHPSRLEKQIDEAARLADPYRVVLVGPFSLEQAQVTGNVNLDRMELRHAPARKEGDAQNATPETQASDALRHVTESRHRALQAAGIKVQRNLSFGRRFRSIGELNLSRAEVGQTFTSSGTHYLSEELFGVVADVKEYQDFPTPKALACQSIRVGSAVELRAPFLAQGVTNFTLADIGGSVRILGAKFANRGDIALEFPSATLRRNLTIDRDTVIHGVVDLIGLRVENDLQIWAGTFQKIPVEKLPVRRGDYIERPGALVSPMFEERAGRKARNLGLRARRMRVMGAFYWGREPGRGREDWVVPRRWFRRRYRPDAVNRDYRMDLRDASVGVLMDHERAWPAKGALWLSGFRYRAIDQAAPVEWWKRYFWIKLQTRRRERLQPQPFEQLTAVYRRMGHTSYGIVIDVRKLRYLHNLPYYILIGLTTRFGYQPVRAILGLVAFWVFGLLVFSTAYKFHHHDGAAYAGKPDRSDIGISENDVVRCMAPSHEEFYVNLTFEEDGTKAGAERRMDNGPAAGSNGDRAAEPERSVVAKPWKVREDYYPRFRPWLYSLDTLIPIMDFFQANYWIPATYDHCHQFRFYTINSAFLSSLFSSGEPFASATQERWIVPTSYTVYIYHFYLMIHVFMGWVFTTIFALAVTGIIRPKPQTGRELDEF